MRSRIAEIKDANGLIKFMNLHPDQGPELVAFVFANHDMLKHIMISEFGLSWFIYYFPEHRENLFKHIIEDDDVLFSMIKNISGGYGLSNFHYEYRDKHELIFEHILSKKNILIAALNQPCGFVNFISTFTDKKQYFAEYVLKEQDVLTSILKERHGLWYFLHSYKDNADFQKDLKIRLVKQAFVNKDLWDLIKHDRDLVNTAKEEISLSKIRRTALFLFLGQRSSESPLIFLPDELIVNIASFMGADGTKSADAEKMAREYAIKPTKK